MAVLMVGLGQPTGATPVRADTTAQLQAERATLLQELAAISPRQTPATGALNNAEDSFNQATAVLNSERAQLATLNSELATLNGEIQADQAQEAAARNALSTLTRATYESVSGNTVMTAVLNAKDFTAAMDSLSGASTVTAQIQGLETTLGHDQADLLTKQGQLQNDFAQASALEGQLSTRSEEHTSELQSRQYLVC